MEGVSDSRVYAYYSNYKPSGAVGQVSHVNGTTDYRYYDPFTMRITSIRTTSILGDLQYWSYGYTPAGDIEEIHNIITDVTYDYTYDELHRLLSETSDGAYPTINYTYNAIGNIMSKTYGINSYAYTYDTTRKHAVANINFNGNNYAYTYDGNGNMTAGPDFTDPTQTATRAITYNADNLPTSIVWTKTATVTSAFTYDGSGTRVKKAIQGGSTTWYIGSHYEKKDSTYTKYIFAGGTRIAKVTTSGYHILHSDHLGSSTIITESSGGVVESTEYNPFGTTRTHSGATLTNYKYTDQELDPETGLYNYGARYYDPMIGRFISPDPIVQAPFNPQSLNRYSYCINSPLMYVDPSGLISLDPRDWFSNGFDFLGDVFTDIWQSELFRMCARAVAFYYGGPLGTVGCNLLFGENLENSVKAGVTATITAAAFYGAGEYIQHLQDVGQLADAAYVVSRGTQVAIHIAAGATAGGINAAITGGDVGLGIATGGISAGMGSYFRDFTPFGSEVAGHAIIGGITGGTIHAMYGGSFSTGFGQGAVTSVFELWYNSDQHPGITKMTKGRSNALIRTAGGLGSLTAGILTANPLVISVSIVITIEGGGLLLIEYGLGGDTGNIPNPWVIMKDIAVGIVESQTSDTGR